jgi:flagellar biosynthesis chaperone FliJ
MSRALPTLIRLRRRALDEAVQDLAESVATETKRRQAVAGLQAQIGHEAALASRDTDLWNDALGAWLPGARLALQAARESERKAADDTELARASVVAARAELESVETFAGREVEAAAALAARAAQHALDEFAQRAGRGTKAKGGW